MWLYPITRVFNPAYERYWDLGLSGPGVSHLPEDGPLIVAMNHVSFLDPWFLASVFPRRLRFLINREWYDRSPRWRAFFHACGTVPVGRDARTTVDALVEVLDRGWVVGIFPEGRISDDGRIGRFRPGLARLAAKSAVPVMPAGIRGAYESLPRTRRWPARGRIRVHLGRPYTFPGAPWAGPPPRRLSKEFDRRTLETICALSGQPAPVRDSVKDPAAPRTARAIS